MSYPPYRHSNRLAWVLVLVTIIDIIAWMIFVAFVAAILWIGFTILTLLMQAGA
jgi:hypothetical protein